MRQQARRVNLIPWPLYKEDQRDFTKMLGCNTNHGAVDGEYALLNTKGRQQPWGRTVAHVDRSVCTAAEVSATDQSRISAGGVKFAIIPTPYACKPSVVAQRPYVGNGSCVSIKSYCGKWRWPRTLFQAALLRPHFFLLG